MTECECDSYFYTIRQCLETKNIMDPNSIGYQQPETERSHYEKAPRAKWKSNNRSAATLGIEHHETVHRPQYRGSAYLYSITPNVCINRSIYYGLLLV